jgi:rare lipoprotein A
MLSKTAYFHIFIALFLVQRAGAVHRAYNTDTSIIQYGVASYYADKFEGRITASGEIFSQLKMTAAHNTLPLGTIIEVTNLRNNRTVYVKINDRLHAKNKRLIDLTKAAARKLHYINAGLTRVRIRVLDKADMQ